MSRGMPAEQRAEFWRDVNRERLRLVTEYFTGRPDGYGLFMRYPIGKLGFETLAKLQDIRCTNWVGHYSKKAGRHIAEMQSLGLEIREMVDELKALEGGEDE